MEFKEFGNAESPKIVLIPGSMMCWKQFDKVIPLLAKQYRVIAVSTDGFDGTGQTTFTTAEDSAKKLADYLTEHHGGHISLVFGESFGCATAATLFNSKAVQVDSLILNGAQYMDFGPLNRIIMQMIPRNQYRFVRKLEQADRRGKIPLMLKLFTNTSEQIMMEMFRRMPDHISLETLENCMKEAGRLYSEIENYQPDPNAKVSIWYGAKEPNMKKAVAALQSVYPNAEDHPFDGLGHGEIIAYPEKMAEEIIRFMEAQKIKGGTHMKAEYKNWVPNGMIAALTAGTAVLGAGTAALLCTKINPTAKKLLAGTTGLGAAACGGMLCWSVYAHDKFSYDGQRQLSKQIVEGTAEYITLPEGGVGLDVGCGSGALTIACAKRNPQGRMVGIDRWGAEYASFSQKLCEKNAATEGADNTEFHHGDACRLDFEDETFDAVTSNYVYHNITGVDKQQLLRETLRVLKKGGTFAIHDIMSKARYGDMQQFINELYDEGYERVQLIDTTNGKFMTRKEAALLMLGGSALLIGKK